MPKPPQPLSQGTERVNLLLKCFVLLFKPLQDLGARISPIMSEFNDPLHLCKRQANSLCFQYEVDLAHDVGGKDAIARVSSVRSWQQSNPLPVAQRFRGDPCALGEGRDAECLSHVSPRSRLKLTPRERCKAASRITVVDGGITSAVFCAAFMQREAACRGR